MDWHIQMTQQSQGLHIKEESSSLCMEIKALEERVAVLMQNSKKERQLNQTIQILQRQSEDHYETLRKLSVEYTEILTTYSSKLDNKSEDICDERDRTQSNIYYLEQQNGKLDEQCKRKLSLRKKLQEEIEQYHQKKEKLLAVLMQENTELAQKIKVNKQIQEGIRATREENEHYQEEIFNADIRAENLKKYGYEVVPQKIAALMEGKEQIEKEIAQLQEQKKREMKAIGKLVRGDVAERGKEELRQQKEKRQHFLFLKKENLQIKQEKERLNAVIYSYQFNPNMEIKQLEENLQQEEEKISKIEKNISLIKKRYYEVTQKIKEYTDYVESIEPRLEGSLSPQQLDSPRKLSKDKPTKKQKFKNGGGRLFQQIKNELQQRSLQKRSLWDILWLTSREKQQKGVINLSETTYRVHRPSQKISIFMTLLFLIGCTYLCHKYYKK